MGLRSPFPPQKETRGWSPQQRVAPHLQKLLCGKLLPEEVGGKVLTGCPPGTGSIRQSLLVAPASPQLLLAVHPSVTAAWLLINLSPSEKSQKFRGVVIFTRCSENSPSRAVTQHPGTALLHCAGPALAAPRPQPYQSWCTPPGSLPIHATPILPPWQRVALLKG